MSNKTIYDCICELQDACEELRDATINQIQPILRPFIACISWLIASIIWIVERFTSWLTQEAEDGA